MGQEELQRDQLRTTIGLAEFTALRAEIGTRMTTQMALVAAGLTALGVIVGFVIPKDASNGGSDHWLLLLVIPPLAAAVNTLWAVENRQIGIIGVYIRDELWPRLIDDLGWSPGSSWESYLTEQHRKGLTNKARSFTTDYTSTLIFAAAAVAALLVVRSHGWSPHERILFWADLVLTAVAVLVPFAMTLGGAKRADKHRTPALPEQERGGSGGSLTEEPGGSGTLVMPLQVGEAEVEVRPEQD